MKEGDSPNATVDRRANSSIMRSFDDDDRDSLEALPPPPPPDDIRCNDDDEEDEEVGDAEDREEEDTVDVDRCGILRGNDGISSSNTAAGSSATFIVVPNCRLTSFATVFSKFSKSS